MSSPLVPDSAQASVARQVRAARARLWLVSWLRAIPWFVAGCVTCVLAAVVWDRWGGPWRVLPAEATTTAVASGMALAAIWSLLRLCSPLGAAQEIDRRFGLNERVSSWLALDELSRAAPMGQALLADAQRRLERIDLSAAFHARPDRWWWVPLAPALALTAAWFWLPTRAPAPAAGRPAVQVRTAARQLQQQLTAHRQEQPKPAAAATEALFSRLEEASRDLAQQDNVDPKAALRKLNDLSREIAERQRELQTGQQLRQQLEQLSQLERGPADRLIEALRGGDMRAAGEALKQLREQLQKDSLTPEAREQLARQLQSLQDKLRDAAEARQTQQRELERQLAEARQAGQTQQAEQLQQKLESLRQTARQDESLAQLADKLKSAAQKVQQGDLSSAEEELRSLGEQLQQLESEDLESQALEEALDALADARQSMVCSDCDGQGCQACRGGEGQGNRPGQGMGRGRGAGERPESPTETGKYDAKTRQQTGRGAADVVDRVEGPNVRGEVQTEIAREFAEARAGAADPLTDQQLPRSQREHAREYFEKLRTGN